MKQVSNEFKQLSLEPIKSGLVAYLSYEDNNGNIITLNEETDLIEIKYVIDSDVVGVAMAQIDVVLKGYHSLAGKYVSVGFGYLELTETSRYIELGKFEVQELEYSEDKQESKFFAYDKLVIANKTFVELGDMTFPATVKDLAHKVLTLCGLDYDGSFDNETFPFLEDNYTGSYLTYRNILDDIAEICDGVIAIKNNKVSLIKRNDTGVVLDTSHIKVFKRDATFGPVNSLVLSRQPQEDNIYSKDDEQIELNGLHELKFNDNLIVDKRREEYVDQLFAKYKGKSWTPVEIETVGVGLFEMNDVINVDIDGEITKVNVLGVQLTLNKGIKEIIRFGEVGKTSTKYEYASDSQRRLKNTEIIVDKQKGEITSIVEATKDLEDEFSIMKQTIEEFDFSIKKVGGMNLIRNSAGWNDKEYWSTLNVETVQSIEISDISLSKSAFHITNGYLYQNIPTEINEDHIFTTKLKLGIGYTKIVIGSDNEETNLITNPDGRDDLVGWEHTGNISVRVGQDETIMKNVLNGSAFVITSTPDDVGVFKQTINNLTIGETYTIYLKYRMNAGLNTIFLDNVNQEQLLNESQSVINEWREIIHVFEAYDTKVTLSFSNSYDYKPLTLANIKGKNEITLIQKNDFVNKLEKNQEYKITFVTKPINNDWYMDSEFIAIKSYFEGEDLQFQQDFGVGGSELQFEFYFKTPKAAKAFILDVGDTEINIENIVIEKTEEEHFSGLIIGDLFMGENEGVNIPELIFQKELIEPADEWEVVEHKFRAKGPETQIRVYNGSLGEYETTGTTVTDLLLTSGRIVRDWSPSPFENYSNNVLIDVEGIKIKNSRSDVETRITNQEFAVYHGSQKALSVNKDLTTLRKTEVIEDLIIGNTRIENRQDGIDFIVLTD